MKPSSYAKIGFFALAAAALAVVGTALMGKKSGAKKEVFFETYIEETVQGISNGSAVRYRGIPIGEVKEVSFAMSRYEVPDDSPDSRRATRYARIVFAIDLTGAPKPDNFRTLLDRQIDDGLRVHLKTQGITGLSYVDLDFEAQPKEGLPVPWEPEYPYIPTAPSLVKTLTDVVQGLSQEIHGFSQIKDSATNLAERIAVLADTANAAVKKLDAGLDGLPGLVASATRAADDADALVKSLGPTAEALPGLVENASGMVAAAGNEVDALAVPLREAAANLARAVGEIAWLAGELRADPSIVLRGEEKETLP